MLLDAEQILESIIDGIQPPVDTLANILIDRRRSVCGAHISMHRFFAWGVIFDPKKLNPFRPLS